MQGFIKSQRKCQNNGIDKKFWIFDADRLSKLFLNAFLCSKFWVLHDIFEKPHSFYEGEMKVSINQPFNRPDKNGRNETSQSTICEKKA